MLKTKLLEIQYLLIIILILTLPYIFAPRLALLLSILIFLISIFNPQTKLKTIFQEKTIIYLFLFILMTYISVLWSPAEHIFKGNFKVNIYAYLNYLFLILGIYFSQLEKPKIIFLFKVIVLSPIVYFILYYSNFFNFSNTYSSHYTGDFFNNGSLYVDLFANIFLLFSSVYIYIKFITNLLQKKYHKAIYFLVAFIMISITLFIDPLTTCRIINLTYFMSIFFISLYHLSKKKRYFIGIIFIFFITFFISTSATYQAGINDVKRAYHTGQFIGSWGVRLNVAYYGLKIWKENPYLGRGITDVIDHMKELKAKHPKDFSREILHFHNQHILILVQVGLVGYCLFLFFIYQLYKIKINDPVINLYKKTTVLIYLCLMFGEHYLQMIHTSTFFALLISLFLLSKKNEEKESK